MPDPLVLCDANVFYSILMTDLILSFGGLGCFATAGRTRFTLNLPDRNDRHVLAVAIE